MPANQYTPFRADFPGFALLDALAVIKDQAANTPAGRVQLAHSAYELLGWGAHATLEASEKGHFFGESPAPLTDDEALSLLEQANEPPDGMKAAFCPITPGTALKLAGWLLKAAEIILPVLL